jgi:hypothetical protein
VNKYTLIVCVTIEATEKEIANGVFDEKIETVVNAIPRVEDVRVVDVEDWV